MKKLTFFITMCFLLAMVAPTAVAQENDTVEEVIQDWPKASAHVAKNIVNKYGTPDGITDTHLIWHNTGGWNVTIVRREPINHDFPLPHKDVLYQNINYDVPVDMYDDLARFDGSLIIEQTRGTMAARCDRIAANYIAVNLAHEIITDQISVEAARQKYGRLIVSLLKGQQSPYYSGFIFPMPRQNTADSDEPVIPKDVIQSLMSKMNMMGNMNNMDKMNGMNGDMMNDNMDNDSMSDNHMENSNNYMSADVARVGANQSQIYGWYLVDAGGRTLYMFKADKRGESSDCYGKCAEAWPPLLTSGNPQAAAEVINSEMLGTIERRDGSLQVTYNGWPLYYFYKDDGQGKFTGQDVKGYGAEWYMMEPNGTILEGENAATNMNNMDDMGNMDNMNGNRNDENYMDDDESEDVGGAREQDYNDDIISKETPISGNDLPKRDKYMPADWAEVGANKSDMYGWYLTAEGRTLYMFKADNRGESSDCYGQCAEVWPPLLTSGNPTAIAEVVNEDMLGTIERRDGALQVTYNGWPLYYYVEDQGQGKFTGQDVKGYGAEWYMMGPSGSYIHQESEGGNMEGDGYSQDDY